MEMLRCDNCGHVEPRGSVGAHRVRLRVDVISHSDDRGVWHACSWGCLAEYARRRHQDEVAIAAPRDQRNLSGVS